MVSALVALLLTLASPAVAGPPMRRPCTSINGSKIDAAYCDAARPLAERVGSLIAAMTPAEKVTCLSVEKCRVPRLGVGMNWKEALHGLRYACVNDLKGRDDPLCPTSFPHAQLLAASWNRSLWGSVGAGISDEARAWYNIWLSGNSTTLSHSPNNALSFFAPDINLCRDPRWGRCLEVPSECPALTGEYAMQFIREMQRPDASGKYRKTLCNAKHWSVYDVEKGADHTAGAPNTYDPTTGWPEGGKVYSRGGFESVVSKQDLAETFWPQFRAASQGADLAGTMCTYSGEFHVYITL